MILSDTRLQICDAITAWPNNQHLPPPSARDYTRAVKRNEWSYFVGNKRCVMWLERVKNTKLPMKRQRVFCQERQLR